MPNLPILRNPGVKTKPLPGVRFPANATAESFGGAAAEQRAQLGLAVARVGGAVHQIGMEEMEHEAVVEARDASNKFRQRIRDVLNAPEGAFSQRGLNARGVAKSAGEEISRIRKELAKTLRTRRGTDLFDAHANAVANESLESLSRHEARELQQADIDTLDASNEESVRDGLTARNDPIKVAGFRRQVMQNAIERSRILGMSPEAAASYSRQALATYDAQLLDGYRADKNWRAALDYFEAHGDDLPPAAKLRIGETLRQESRRDMLLARSIAIAKGPQTEAEKFAAVDAEFKDADERTYVRSRVKETVDQDRMTAERDQQAKEDAALTEAYKQWKAGNIKYELPPGFDYRIQHAADAMRRQLLGTGTMTTDWERYKVLLRQSEEDPEAFRKVDMNAERGRLDEPELRELAKLQADRTSQTDWNREVEVSISSAYDRLPRGPIEARAKTDGDRNADRARFRNAVRMALIDAKPGDREGLQKAIDGQILKVVEDRPWYQGDREAYRYQVNEGFYVPEEKTNATAEPSKKYERFANWLQGTTPPAVPLPQEPSRPSTVPRPAIWDHGKQQWQLIRNGRTIEAYDTEGRPVSVRD